MATSADLVRAELAVVSAAAVSELQDVAEGSLGLMLEAVPLIVPSYYDAAGALAVAWYDELRVEADVAAPYVPQIIGDPATDWIEREIEKQAKLLEAGLDDAVQQILDDAAALAAKEVARGFRDSMIGNTRQDQEAIGWSRIARPDGCKFCVMLADKGAVYRSESTAIFAAHTNCNCAARPEFRGGDHGPEATVEQYLASSRRAKSERAQAARNARVREYLNENYPDARG